MGLKQAAKKAVLATGLFPAVRSLKRRFDNDARIAFQKDVQLYSQFIKPGDLVFDVGVNLAQKATVFSACGARVVAVEPNPLCFDTIHREMKGKAFTLVPKALAEKPGRLMLNVVGTESTASLRTDWQALHDHGSPTQVPVEVTTLDALIEQHGVPDFCKIDVEGFELEVLKGLSRPLKVVTFEYHADERDQMIACLERLEALAPITLNFININDDHFELPNWLTLKQFILIAPELPVHGDCFVMSLVG